MNGEVKKRVFQIIKAALFCILLALVLYKVQETVTSKFPISKVSLFYDEKKDYDVLMFGSSHMETYISPMDLWDDYGYTSYNFGNVGERVAQSYWTMRNAVNHKKPKIIILDTYMFGRNYKHEEGRTDPTHTAWDGFPLTVTKIQGIRDMFDDSDIQLEFMFPFCKFHSRWNELNETDFYPKPSVSMGLRSYDEAYLLEVVPQKEPELTTESIELNDEMTDVIYLNKFIEFCEEQDIRLLLVHTPYSAETAYQQCVNAAKQLAAERGIPFIDFVAMDSVIDVGIDMYNPSHVNPSGMRKVTHYIGDYLNAHYDLSDKRTNREYDNWNEKYAAYSELKRGALKRCKNVESSLMLLHDDDRSAIISIKKDSALYKNELVMQVLQNINREHVLEADKDIKSKELITLTQLADAQETGEEYVLAVNPKTKEIMELTGAQENAVLNLNDNSFLYTVDDEGGYPVLMDMDEEKRESKKLKNYFSVKEDMSRPDMQIFILDNRSNEILMVKQFWVKGPVNEMTINGAVLAR